MRIGYDVTPEDLEYFFYLSLKVNYWVPYFLFTLPSATCVGLVVYLAVQYDTNRVAPAAAFGAWAGMSAAALLGCTYTRVVKALTRQTATTMLLRDRTGGLCGRRTLETTPEWLVVTSDFSESRLAWKGVHEVVLTKDYLLIYPIINSAYVIKRKFASDGFIDEVRGLTPEGRFRTLEG